MDDNNFPSELDKKWLKEINDSNPSKEKKAAFIKAIAAVKNTWELADWRYELGLDSKNPNKSHWMTRYINRELRKRKEQGNEARVQSRFWISTIIAVISVVIALSSLLIGLSKN